MNKNKTARDFYDQEAQNYKKMYEPGYEHYPANLIRLKLIIKRLNENKARKILDAGCGTAIPMIKLLKQGFDVEGFVDKAIGVSADFHNPPLVNTKQQGGCG